jgi:hypothetical protein
MGKEEFPMEMSMTTGTRCFPPFGPLAVPGGIQSKRPRTAPYDGARWLLAERPFHPVLINPTTDRMQKSASEP